MWENPAKLKEILYLREFVYNYLCRFGIYCLMSQSQPYSEQYVFINFCLESPAKFDKNIVYKTLFPETLRLYRQNSSRQRFENLLT